MKINFCLLFLLFVTTLNTVVAQSPVKSIGKIVSVSISDQTVNITTNNAFASVTVYSPGVIRVRIDKQKLNSDFSYAVISKPEDIHSLR